MGQRNILLCSTGSVGVLNIPQYILGLKKVNTNVRLIPSPSSLRFMPECSLRMLLGERVFTDQDEMESGETYHIRLAKWADLNIVIPATANTIAKLAHGIADNLLLTTLLASKSPTLIVPNMNELMWEARALQMNISKLKEIGYVVVPPILQEGYETAEKDFIKQHGMLTPRQLVELLKTFI